MAGRAMRRRELHAGASRDTTPGRTQMLARSRYHRRAFSLVELVIVVVIIGIIAAIAIPRMSRGAAGAADSALSANLAILRNAISLYEQEHGGAFPVETTFEDQLTKYTDDQGAVSATKTGNYIYGPYLKAVPPCPVGPQKGKVGVAATGSETTSDGWSYEQTTGTIKSNTGTARDVRNILYTDY